MNRYKGRYLPLTQLINFIFSFYMLGALVAGGLAIAGSAIGGALSSRAARKAQRERKKALDKQLESNQRWYERVYNEDATMRADTQRLLTRAEDAIRKRNKELSGQQAVMGGSEEAAAAAKAANNEILADTTADIVANAEARKDAVEEAYMERKNQLEAGKLDVDVQANLQRSQAVAGAVGGAVSAAGNIAGALADTAQPKTKQELPTVKNL